MNEEITDRGLAAYIAGMNKIHEAICELGGVPEYVETFGIPIENAIGKKLHDAYCMDPRITGLNYAGLRTPGNNICDSENIEPFAALLCDAGIGRVMWHRLCGAGKSAYLAKEKITPDYDGDSMKNLGAAIDDYVRQYTEDLARTMLAHNGEKVLCEEVPFDGMKKNPFDPRLLYVAPMPFDPKLCGLPPGLVLGGAPFEKYNPLKDSLLAVNVASSEMKFTEDFPMRIIYLGAPEKRIDAEVLAGLKRIARSNTYGGNIVVEEVRVPQFEMSGIEKSKQATLSQIAVPNIETVWRNALGSHY